MRPLSAAMLLDVWERGHPLPPARQALLLLAAACHDETPEALVALPVGRRDDQLLTLRAWTFGERLAGAVACPGCGELLELDVVVDALRAGSVDGDVDTAPALWLERDGYAVRHRLPTTADLLALLEIDEPTPADLLARCVVEATAEGLAVDPRDLPEEVVTALAAQIEAADPQSNVILALSCAACDHAWESPFDIVSFFWAEIERWAQRMLREVHTLAVAYGWAEADILAMSAGRRAAYLSLIRE